MSAVTTDAVELTTGPNDEVLHPNERAKRLYPVLSEYAEKLGVLSEKLLAAREKYASRTLDVSLIDFARGIALHDTIYRRVGPILSTASTLLDHAKLDEFIADELALRWDEAEEQFRQSKLIVDETVDFLRGQNLKYVRDLIEKSGRYKSPV